MQLASPVFENHKPIPRKYTCEGHDISPPLEIKDLPSNTKSLALVVDDPDAPMGTFDHWIEWNIPRTDHITEDSNPGISGINGMGKTGYHGPCPPSGAVSPSAAAVQPSQPAPASPAQTRTP